MDYQEQSSTSISSNSSTEESFDIEGFHTKPSDERQKPYRTVSHEHKMYLYLPARQDVTVKFQDLRSYFESHYPGAARFSGFRDRCDLNNVRIGYRSLVEWEGSLSNFINPSMGKFFNRPGTDDSESKWVTDLNQEPTGRSHWSKHHVPQISHDGGGRSRFFYQPTDRMCFVDLDCLDSRDKKNVEEYTAVDFQSGFTTPYMIAGARRPDEVYEDLRYHTEALSSNVLYNRLGLRRDGLRCGGTKRLKWEAMEGGYLRDLKQHVILIDKIYATWECGRHSRYGVFPWGGTPSKPVHLRVVTNGIVNIVTRIDQIHRWGLGGYQRGFIYDIKAVNDRRSWDKSWRSNTAEEQSSGLFDDKDIDEGDDEDLNESDGDPDQVNGQSVDGGSE